MNEQLHVYMSNRHKETFAFVWSSLLLAVFFSPNPEGDIWLFSCIWQLGDESIRSVPKHKSAGGKSQNNETKDARMHRETYCS